MCCRIVIVILIARIFSHTSQFPFYSVILLRACDCITWLFIGWIFPGDDPAEVAKPLAPPPAMGQIPTEEVKKDDNGPKDPLASMMAPPVSRGLSSKKRMMGGRGGGPPGMMSSPPGMMRGGGGPPGMMMASPAVFTPKAAVFTPKPAAAVTEDETNNTTETTE